MISFSLFQYLRRDSRDSPAYSVIGPSCAGAGSSPSLSLRAASQRTAWGAKKVIAAGRMCRAPFGFPVHRGQRRGERGRRPVAARVAARVVVRGLFHLRPVLAIHVQLFILRPLALGPPRQLGACRSISGVLRGGRRGVDLFAWGCCLGLRPQHRGQVRERPRGRDGRGGQVAFRAC